MRKTRIRILLFLFTILAGLIGMARRVDPHENEPVSFLRDKALAEPFPERPLDRPLVIAHRGASGHLPEHTLASKALAFGMGADYLEQDVVATKDNELIVLHDIHIDTVTDVALKFPSRKREDGRYYAIDFTLGEISSLQAFERIDRKTGKAVFKERFPLAGKGFQIPSLGEEIEMILSLNRTTRRNTGLYIEYKAPKWHQSEGKDIAEMLMKTIEKYNLNRRDAKIFVQCFDPVSLESFANKYKPHFPLIQLIGDDSWKESDASYKEMLTENGIKKVSAYAAGIGPWIPQVLDALDEKKAVRKASFLEAAHQLRLQIHPYTLRTDELPKGYASASALLDVLFRSARVTGIFADQPDVVVDYLKNSTRVH